MQKHSGSTDFYGKITAEGPSFFQVEFDRPVKYAAGIFACVHEVEPSYPKEGSPLVLGLCYTTFWTFSIPVKGTVTFSYLLNY